MRTSVIVGVDGSPSAIRAADHAAALAIRHGLSLDVVHVFSWPASYPPLLPESVAVRVDPRAVARELVETAAAEVGERYPGLPVEPRLIDGNAAGALVDASRRAAHLVVGHRGAGGFSELLLGSVGVHTTTHARCPVVVVRGESGDPDAHVVVGVDGSMPARAAARYGIADHFPDVKVRRELRHGDSPPQVLVALATEIHAGLVVVGSRGVGGFRGLLLGGTGRALVDHSPCPIMVIRKDAVR